MYYPLTHQDMLFRDTAFSNLCFFHKYRYPWLICQFNFQAWSCGSKFAAYFCNSFGFTTLNFYWKIPNLINFSSINFSYLRILVCFRKLLFIIWNDVNVKHVNVKFAKVRGCLCYFFIRVHSFHTQFCGSCFSCYVLESYMLYSIKTGFH